MTDETWITKNGTKIPVEDMTEAHVKNALRMIIRKSREDSAHFYTNWENEFWEDMHRYGSG